MVTRVIKEFPEHKILPCKYQGQVRRSSSGVREFIADVRSQMHDRFALLSSSSSQSIQSSAQSLLASSSSVAPGHFESSDSVGVNFQNTSGTMIFSVPNVGSLGPSSSSAQHTVHNSGFYNYTTSASQATTVNQAHNMACTYGVYHTGVQSQMSVQPFSVNGVPYQHFSLGSNYYPTQPLPFESHFSTTAVSHGKENAGSVAHNMPVPAVDRRVRFAGEVDAEQQLFPQQSTHQSVIRYVHFICTRQHHEIDVCRPPEIISDDVADSQNLSVVEEGARKPRSAKRRVSANRKERRRTQSINGAFGKSSDNC